MPAMFDDHIGKVIAWHRNTKGIKQAAIAKSIGRSLQIVGAIENGRSLTFERLVQICGALDVPVLTVLDQAYAAFRKEVIRNSGGSLKDGTELSLPEVENALDSLLSNAGDVAKAVVRYLRQPSSVELALATPGPEETDDRQPPKRRGRPPKAAGTKRKSGSGAKKR